MEINPFSDVPYVWYVYMYDYSHMTEWERKDYSHILEWLSRTLLSTDTIFGIHGNNLCRGR